MKKTAILLACMLAALMLASCEPCPYHDHSQPETSLEGFEVVSTDNIGGLVFIEGGSYDEDAGNLTLDIQHGAAGKECQASAYLDGAQLHEGGGDTTFSCTYGDGSCRLGITGMPKGRHVLLVTIHEEGTAAGFGSLEVVVEIPCSISIGG